MKKNLPGIFVSPVTHNFNNVQNTFYSAKEASLNRGELAEKIDNILADNDFIYKRKVRIATRDGIFVKTIIGKNNNTLLTIDNEVIDFDVIRDIEKI